MMDGDTAWWAATEIVADQKTAPQKDSVQSKVDIAWPRLIQIADALWNARHPVNANGISATPVSLVQYKIVRHQMGVQRTGDVP